ncbi:MAG: hypothetical protein HRU43_01705 [Simkaniaceae bacterium]|nr:hypothetical protein [Simkaniaceae bacterium]
MVTGGTVSALWPLINPYLPVPIEPLLPAFILSLIANWAASYNTSREVSAQEWA